MPPTSTHIARLIAALTACAAGCSPSGGDPAEAVRTGPSVRDSAGIAIVEYAALPSEVPEWSLGEPTVRVGSVSDAGPALFSRVETAAATADGGVVVVDRQSQEVRAFDAAGEHLWTAGGPGDGPGEFRQLAMLGVLPDDSVAAFDPGHRRVTVFTRNGELARTHTLPADDRPPSSGGVSDAGHLIGMRGASGVVSFSDLPDPPAVYTLSAERVHYAPAGGEALAVGRVRPSAQYITFDNRGGGIASTLFPLGRRTIAAVGATRAAVATQERFEVFLFEEAGAPVQILRVDLPPELVDRDAGLEGGWYEIAGMMADTLPAHGDVHVDTADRLWIAEAELARFPEDISWWVFAADGSAVGRLRTAGGFTIEDIGTDHVVGVVQDSLGVQFVERRPIVR